MTLQVNLVNRLLYPIPGIRPSVTQATYLISPCVRAIPTFKFLILWGWQGIEIAKD